MRACRGGFRLLCARFAPGHLAQAPYAHQATLPHAQCNADCVSATIVAEGECASGKVAAEECACTREFDPVCGDEDGITYGSPVGVDHSVYVVHNVP